MVTVDVEALRRAREEIKHDFSQQTVGARIFLSSALGVLNEPR